jgi:hypothetical protein
MPTARGIMALSRRLTPERVRENRGERQAAGLPETAKINAMRNCDVFSPSSYSEMTEQPCQVDSFLI